MIINLLMEADARGTRGQQRRDGSAAQSTRAGLHVSLGFSLWRRPMYCIAPKALFRILTISYSFWVVGIVVSFSISF